MRLPSEAPSSARHFDVVLRARLHAEVSTDLAVDRDPARGYQFIAVPARSDTGSREKTIKAHNRDS